MKEILLKTDDNNEVYVSEVVIANIIAETLNIFEDIKYAGGKKGINQFLKRNKFNLEQLQIEGQLKADLKIQVPFGVNIPMLTQSIQKKIIENFNLFLELENVKIDVIVDGFIKSNEK